MDSITRNISDLGSADRQALERVIGAPLGDHQSVTIQVASVPSPPPCTTPRNSNSSLPEWCQIYAGLSEDEIDRLDQATKRRLDPSRTDP